MSTVLDLIEKVASNPATHHQALENIFLDWHGDEKICKLLARNPNTNIWTLTQLAPDYINDMLENPLLPLMVFEQNFDLDLILNAQGFGHIPAIRDIRVMPDFIETWVMSYSRLDYEFADNYRVSKTSTSKQYQDWVNNTIYPF